MLRYLSYFTFACCLLYAKNIVINYEFSIIDHDNNKLIFFTRVDHWLTNTYCIQKFFFSETFTYRNKMASSVFLVLSRPANF